ncbi:MAG: 30S ribosomal protein S16 [Patescibacteria group bacterium]|nr:30S ribosomal protein S16 [Patescibacteria group bacterium]
MLKIRMQRTGRLNMPSYRIVVVEHTAGPKGGRFLEKVGAYNPKTKERTLNEERVKYWMSVGAKPSDTVHNMLVTLGIIDAKKINVLPKKSPPKKEEVAEEKPAEVATPATEEAPAEDKSTDEPKAAAADSSGEEKEESAPLEEPAEAAAETPAEEPKEAETKPE